MGRTRLRDGSGRMIEVSSPAEVPMGTRFLSEDTEEIVYRPAADRVIWGDVIIRLVSTADDAKVMPCAAPRELPSDAAWSRSAPTTASSSSSSSSKKKAQPPPFCARTNSEIATALGQQRDVMALSSAYAAADLSPPGTPKPDELSQSEVCEALEAEEKLMPFDFSLIHNDPRFVRLVNKYDPSYFSAEGLKQHMKNFVDVVNVPYVGVLVSSYRMMHAKSRLKSLNAVRRGEKKKDDNLVAMLTAMRSNARTHVATAAADIGLGVVTSVVPVVDWVPGLSTGLASTIGSVGTSVASKTIGVGTNVVIKTAVGTVAGMTTAEESREKVMSNWGVTKAFISYLGYPLTEDVVYSQWEPSRIRLKLLFGAAPEANIYNMEPKGDLLETIRKQEEQGILQVEIPLLLLLFRVYDCWDRSYYDRLEGFKRALSKTFLPGSLDDEDYQEDARRVMPSLWHSKLRIGLRKRVRLLSKYERRAAINCLTNYAMQHSAIGMLLGKEQPTLKTVRWLMKALVEFFVDEAQVWVYLESDDVREVQRKVEKVRDQAAASSSASTSAASSSASTSAASSSASTSSASSSASTSSASSSAPSTSSASTSSSSVDAHVPLDTKSSADESPLDTKTTDAAAAPCTDAAAAHHTAASAHAGVAPSADSTKRAVAQDEDDDDNDPLEEVDSRGLLPTVTRLGDTVQAVVLWEAAGYPHISLHSALVSFSTHMLDALSVDLGSVARVREHFRILDKNRKRYESHFPRNYGVLHMMGWCGEETDAIEQLLGSVLANGHEIALFQSFTWALGCEAPVLDRAGFEPIVMPERKSKKKKGGGTPDRSTHPISAFSNKPNVPSVEELFKAEAAMEKQREAEAEAAAAAAAQAEAAAKALAKVGK